MPQSTNAPQWPEIGRLFSLGGMSECGKSHAGRYFDAHGVRRIKIGRVLAEVGSDLGLDPAAPNFTSRLYDEHAEVALPAFLGRVADEMRREGVVRASLESMSRGQLATWLKGQLGDRMVNIFIEAPLALRIEREWRKRPGSEREAIGTEVRAKDELKVQRGVPDLRAIADLVIDNSGTAAEYDRELIRVLRDYPAIPR